MTRRLSRGLLLLYPVGAILFVVGVWGGLPEAPQGWWDTTGFVVNLVSGLTAACIGIPTAFFVLQKLLDDRAKRIAREEAILLSLRNLLAIEADFLSIWGIGRGEAQDKCISMQLITELQRARSAASQTAGRHSRTVKGNGRKQSVVSRPDEVLLPYEDPQPPQVARDDALERLDHQRRVIADRSISNGIAPTPNASLAQILSVLHGAAETDLLHPCRRMRARLPTGAGPTVVLDEWSRVLTGLELELSQRRAWLTPLIAEIDRHTLLLAER
ncbi:hypothetical protein [Actinomycetospora corticicola]|uniref:Uncharacterized protein n=1 Tax=Actinomycetospora corticicola TaxID=663602 RepID=A0A7Y9DYB0_9PSEU|nr:hypothetical protein [Actinomycetospora corticicola]NYD37691.1 hypothetical protein [Actinomycetospora corticicola]